MHNMQTFYNNQKAVTTPKEYIKQFDQEMANVIIGYQPSDFKVN